MKTVILDVPGIGPAAAELLAEHSINTADDLAKASVEQVVAVPGFSVIRATRVIAAATELLSSSGKPAAGDKSGGKEKKGKKAKGKKKDKQGKKGKGKGKKKDKKGKKGKKGKK